MKNLFENWRKYMAEENVGGQTYEQQAESDGFKDFKDDGDRGDHWEKFEGGKYLKFYQLGYENAAEDWEMDRYYDGLDENITVGVEKTKSTKLACPPATQDLALNTKNRDATIKKYNYGPLNVDEPGDYWQKIAKYWKTDEKAARKSLCGNCVAFDISKRMKDCLPGDTFDDDGELGYCWMHHFKCHSARSCHTWAKGGPIKDEKESAEWQNKAKMEESAFPGPGPTKEPAVVDEDNKMSPEEAIAEEGGALGFSKWEELTGMSRDELEKYVKDNDNIKIHKHGDIIDAGGLNEETELAEDVVVDEGKICAKGKAWAMRKYGKWSAYAAMGASRYCKEPGWGRGKKKKKKKKKKSKKKNEEVRDTYGSEVVDRNAQSRKNAMKDLTEDSLDEGELKKWRDENWQQSDGTPCGDAKKQKNPKRCKPKSKWATMDDDEKAADDAKKKAGGKKGKQFVSATKKGKVTKSHTKENYMKEELGKNYHLGRHQHENPTTLYINFRNLKDVGENMPGGVDPNKISELIEQVFHDNNADYFLHTPFSRRDKQYPSVRVDNTGGGGYIDPSQSKYKVFLKFENEEEQEDFKTEELDLIMQQVNDKVEKYAMELKQYKLDLKEGMNISENELAQIIKEELKAILSEEYYEVDAKDVNEEYCPVCREAQELEEKKKKKKKKKACKPSKGKRFAKRVDGKCRSYGQAGKAKGGGDRIRPGTKKGDAYCARSAGIKKCKNPPCANTLSRKKWKCRGKKSMK